MREWIILQIGTVLFTVAYVIVDLIDRLPFWRDGGDQSRW